MTSYQNTIMDLLKGKTPKAKHDYLVALILDRDKFAIEFAEWLKHGQYESAESDNGVHEYVNIWDNKSESFTISELLQLFHSQKQTQG